MRLLFLLLAALLISCSNSFGQVKYADSLKNHLNNQSADTAKVKDLLAISEFYVDENIDSSVKYALQAADLATKISDFRHAIRSSSLLGEMYDKVTKYDKALEYKLGTLKLAESAGDTLEIIKANSSLAAFYGYSLRNNPTAITYANSAIELARKLHNDEILYNELEHISNYYFNAKNFDKVLALIQEQISIANKNNDPLRRGTLNCAIGDVLRAKGDFLKCIEYYDKGIVILQTEGKKDVNGLMQIAFMYSNASLAYISLGRNAEAIEKIQQAVKIFKEVNSPDGLANANSRLVNIYISMKDWASAKSYNAPALAHYKQNNMQVPYLQALQNNAEILFNTGDYKLAFQDLDQFVKLKLSIQDQASQNRLSELEASVAAERKQKEIDLLTKDKQYQSKIRILFLVGFVILIVVIVIIFNGLQKNRQANKLLKEKNNIIGEQKAILEEKNTSITDSIHYARKIQNAILPEITAVKIQFPQSFVLYKPKDIVSGDFYWMEVVGNTVLLAACDCTGHGVPGALVSVICHNALSRSVLHYALTDPAQILAQTSQIVADNFSKGGDGIQDGMDISLLVYNKEEQTIKWAGANNPLWIISGGELKEIKGDKNAIGNNYKNTDFHTHEVAINAGDKFYLFSDGFADQFGGQHNKKLQKKNFKELLLSINKQSMADQQTELDIFIKNYQGKEEQTDDMLVIGVEIG